MSAGASSTSNGHRIPWWRRLLRSAGAASGVVAVAATSTVAPAQDAFYRSAATVPASWQAFARTLQGRFQERLGGDDEAGRRLQEAMQTYKKQSSQTVVIRAWIAANGKVERLEFDGLDQPEIAVNLRALLADVAVSPPPVDMLQPLHLRLSLRAGDARKEQ